MKEEVLESEYKENKQNKVSEYISTLKILLRYF